MTRQPLKAEVGDPYDVETDEIKHVKALQMAGHAHVCSLCSDVGHMG